MRNKAAKFLAFLSFRLPKFYIEQVREKREKEREGKEKGERKRKRKKRRKKEKFIFIFFPGNFFFNFLV